MATRKEIMQNLVKEEAKNLKKHATKEELDNLNIEYLDSEDYEKCVYGQLTGDCFSERAEYLILNSCERVYESDYTISKSKINGKPLKDRRTKYWSPIEVFIAQNINNTNGNNKILIDYLKDKRKTLNFK
jgi:hypothetical protein